LLLRAIFLLCPAFKVGFIEHGGKREEERPGMADGFGTLRLWAPELRRLGRARNSEAYVAYFLQVTFGEGEKVTTALNNVVNCILSPVLYVLINSKRTESTESTECP
jgi:hypothetical protein